MVFQAGQYEDSILRNSTWSTGDWTGDGEFDSADLIAAFELGLFESGGEVSTVPVPEPTLELVWIYVVLIWTPFRMTLRRR